MTFGTRNAYYLRISRITVLPLYLYLDERHLDWMSDVTLQHVLSDLKPLIPLKIEAESNAQLELGGPAHAKKGTVDVHRGDCYQFAYFFRQAEPHSVLIKNRNFTLTSPMERQNQPPPNFPKKHKARLVAKALISQPGNRRQVTRAPQDNDEYLEISSGDDEQPLPIILVKNEEEEADPFGNLDPDAEEEATKPKPVLSLSYQNFELPGRCLCVIVEPWPVVKAANRASRAPSLAASLRGSSIAPPGFVTSKQLAARGRTPLFLPDDDDDEPDQKPPNAPQFPQRKVLPAVPAFDEDAADEEDENAELMQFSQALNTSGIHGEVDDDDFEGAVFFADADEAREM